MSKQKSTVVVLTPEIRKIPYFSSFSNDEKEVVIPVYFDDETIINYNKVRTEELEKISTEKLTTIIETRSYIGFERSGNDRLIKELLWRLGETEEKMKIIEKNNIIYSELKPYFEKEDYEYIYGVRCMIVEEHINKIVKFGNLRLVKWAVSKEFTWDNATCSIAAANSQLDVLIWLRQHGFPWSEDVCNKAAENGHLNILKWARKNGCYRSEETCKWAAKNGHLDVLKWLREKDECPWYPWECYSLANNNGHFDTSKWIRNNSEKWYY